MQGSWGCCSLPALLRDRQGQPPLPPWHGRMQLRGLGRMQPLIFQRQERAAFLLQGKKHEQKAQRSINKTLSGTLGAPQTRLQLRECPECPFIAEQKHLSADEA